MPLRQVYRRVRKDGTALWVESCGHIVKRPEGHFIVSAEWPYIYLNGRPGPQGDPSRLLRRSSIDGHVNLSFWIDGLQPASREGDPSLSSDAPGLAGQALGGTRLPAVIGSQSLVDHFAKAPAMVPDVRRNSLARTSAPPPAPPSSAASVSTSAPTSAEHRSASPLGSSSSISLKPTSTAMASPARSNAESAAKADDSGHARSVRGSPVPLSAGGA